MIDFRILLSVTEGVDELEKQIYYSTIFILNHKIIFQIHLQKVLILQTLFLFLFSISVISFFDLIGFIDFQKCLNA